MRLQELATPRKTGNGTLLIQKARVCVLNFGDSGAICRIERGKGEVIILRQELTDTADPCHLNVTSASSLTEQGQVLGSLEIPKTFIDAETVLYSNSLVSLVPCLTLEKQASILKAPLPYYCPTSNENASWSRPWGPSAHVAG